MTFAAVLGSHKRAAGDPPSMTDTALAQLQIDRREDGGAVVMLPSGTRPVVVMDRDLLAGLDATMDALEKDPPAWVVLTSDTERSFVAGADLNEINGLSDAALTHYMVEGQRIFGRLAAFSRPVVAAIGGAALGGGLELALHCHAIVATHIGRNDKPYPIGLPEAGLGLCPAWGGTQLLAGRIDPSIAIQATAAGRLFKSNAIPQGLADCTVASNDELLEAACTHGAGMHACVPKNVTQANADAVQGACREARKLDTAAATAVVDCIETSLRNGLEAGLQAEREHIVALRNTTDTRARIEEFLHRG